MVDFFYPERNHSNLEDTFTLILSQARPGKDLKGCYIMSQSKHLKGRLGPRVSDSFEPHPLGRL